MLFILYYLLHMKMKKMLVGAFLGMFALAGVAVLPNYASAQTDWDNPTGSDMITGKSQAWSQLLTSVQKTINWLLWILATIALAIMIYAGFLMVTSAGDEKKYSKGLWIIKYAAIGLAIIGLSWLIVSVIFWFIRLQWGGQDVQTIDNSQVTNTPA